MGNPLARGASTFVIVLVWLFGGLLFAAGYGGGKRTWRLQQDMTLEKRGGEWVFTHSKASTY